MLSIQVEQKSYFIAIEQVEHIGYIKPHTPLPFVRPPIEGLTSLSKQPVIQIDMARALEAVIGKGQKRLIITTNAGKVSLRVDDILSVSAENKLISQQTKILQLDELLPWTNQHRVNLSRKRDRAINTPDEESADTLTVLLVKSGNINLALSVDNIDHIQELLICNIVQTSTTQETLIHINEHLLPARSLSYLYNGHAPTVAEHTAVIVHSSQGAWALLVEKVIGLKNVSHIYLSTAQSHDLQSIAHVKQLLGGYRIDEEIAALHFWRITQHGLIQELMNANSLLCARNQLSVHIIESQREESSMTTSHSLSQRENEGLKISCGSNDYLLPLVLINRTINGLNIEWKSKQRFLSDNRNIERHQRIPLINATALLSAKISLSKTRFVVLVSLNKQMIMLAIEHATLYLSTNHWFPLSLPQPASLYIDAATYDNQTQQWVLRLNSTISFGALPFHLKKAAARSIMGWFDKTNIDTVL